MPTVLVTDGEQRVALAATRSLGRAGYRVLVASHQGVSLAGSSRWAAARLRVPDPLRDAGAFVQVVSQTVRDEGVRVLLPMTDQSILPLLEQRAAFEPALIPLPSVGVWTALGNKPLVLGRAEQLGIRVPAQVTVPGPAGFEPLPPLRFPVVVKPARSLVTRSEGRVKLGVQYATSPSALVQILGEVPAGGFPVLLQERVVGPGMGVFLLLTPDGVLASFAHRRLLEKPPSGGVSVCSESVSLSRQTLERSVALLRSMEWTGVAMVEYKADRQSGDLFLMEVNGRFWGSLQLAIDAGVDFPRLLVERTLGGHPAPVHSWREGIRCRWRLGEIDHLIARLNGGRGIALPQDLPSLGTAFRHALVPAVGPRERSEVFRWEDPRPAWAELRAWTIGR